MLCGMSGCRNGRSQASDNVVREFRMVAIPPVYTDPQARADYLAAHYWDNFDFADTAYYGSSAKITEQAVVNYIDILKYVDYGHASQSITGLLNRAVSERIAYEFFAATFESYLYNPNSPMRNEELYMAVLEQMVVSGLLDETQKSSAQKILRDMQKNRPGTPAAEIRYQTPSGSMKRLSELQSEYAMIVFHNLGCEACRTLIDRIEQSEAIKIMQARKRLSILAIYPDRNKDEWLAHLSEIPKSWLSGYDYNGEIDEQETYVLYAIPTIYLLDRNKYVILRDASVAEVEQTLMVIAEQM